MKFKIFNKVKEIVSQATAAETIAAIHNEFDTAADRALAEARRILSEDGVNELEKEKALLMQKHGFQGTKVSAKYSERMREEVSADRKANIVKKYKNKYPQYKFIFREQVIEICTKYNLLCGPSNHYKGDIPLKNLKEIESFQVNDEDRYSMWNYSTSFSLDVSIVLLADGGANIISYAEHQRHEQRLAQMSGEWIYENLPSRYMNDGYTTAIPFFICAPESDMNMEGQKKKGVFTYKEIPDPIVLHYVKDGFLIVTKWGLEGDDSILK